MSDIVYQTAGGTGTALTVTIKGTFVNGYPITFIASANNSGAATTINGKKLYKPGTTTAPNLIAGKAYTVWYNQAGDCFFIKASAEGDAIAANVLAGKKFSNNNDTGLVGTLDLSNLVSGNIRSGVTINGVSGKASVVDTADANASTGNILNGQTAYVNGNKINGNMANYAETNQPIYNSWTDGVGNLFFRPANTGYYVGGGHSGLYGYDANFIAQNIVAGKSIFGVAGQATIETIGGKRYLEGSFQGTGGYVTITVGFTPRLIILSTDNQSMWCYCAMLSICTSPSSRMARLGTTYLDYFTVTSNGFTTPFSTNTTVKYTWYAWG